jgi:hypothetical protein
MTSSPFVKELALSLPQGRVRGILIKLKKGANPLDRPFMFSMIE